MLSEANGQPVTIISGLMLHWVMSPLVFYVIDQTLRTVFLKFVFLFFFFFFFIDFKYFFWSLYQLHFLSDSFSML